MKNRIRISAFWLLLPLLVSACSGSLNTGSSSEPVSSGDSSETSLNWGGVYKGILPCADCDGIETVITLRKDRTYKKDTRYLGKDHKVFTAEGTFSWYNNGTSIMLSGIKDGPARYLVGENRIFQLDKEGKWITGELANRYVLKFFVCSASLCEILGSGVPGWRGSGTCPYCRKALTNDSL